jgi:hypothetical protein
MARRTFRYSSTVKMPPPSLLPERAKVADFYSAGSGTIPPLQWQTFPPRFSPFGDAKTKVAKELRPAHWPAAAPELIDELIRQVSRTTDGARIEAPYLQLALKRLWVRTAVEKSATVAAG